MRALVAAGERAARSWACVGCDARGTGDGVAVVRFMGMVEDGAGRGAPVREGAIIMCSCRLVCISYPPLRPAGRVARSVCCFLLCSSFAWIGAGLRVYLC